MYSAKLKVNFMSGEVEVAGEEGFVRDQINMPGKLSDLLKELRKEFFSKEMNSTKDGNLEFNSEVEDNNNHLTVSGTIGEWFHKFKKELTETEKALIAAYYIQNNSAENEFKTIEVTKILKDYGIRLSNTSFFVNSLQSQGYMFPTEKRDNVMFRRVSTDGVEYLKTLVKNNDHKNS